MTAGKQIRGTQFEFNPKKKQKTVTVTGKKARHDLNRMFENSSDQCCIEWGEEKEETKVKDRTIKRNKTNMFIFWMNRAYRATSVQLHYMQMIIQ